MGGDNLKPWTTPLSFGVGEKVRTPYSTWYKEQQDVPEYTGTVTRLIGDHTVLVVWDQDEAETEIPINKLTRLENDCPSTSTESTTEKEQSCALREDSAESDHEESEEQVSAIVSDGSLSEESATVDPSPEKVISPIRMKNISYRGRGRPTKSKKLTFGQNVKEEVNSTGQEVKEEVKLSGQTIKEEVK